MTVVNGKEAASPEAETPKTVCWFPLGNVQAATSPPWDRCTLFGARGDCPAGTPLVSQEKGTSYLPAHPGYPNALLDAPEAAPVQGEPGKAGQNNNKNDMPKEQGRKAATPSTLCHTTCADHSACGHDPSTLLF